MLDEEIYCKQMVSSNFWVFLIYFKASVTLMMVRMYMCAMMIFMVIKIMYVCVSVGAVANLGHKASHATQIFIFSRASHNLLISTIQGPHSCE